MKIKIIKTKTFLIFLVKIRIMSSSSSSSRVKKRGGGGVYNGRSKSSRRQRRCKVVFRRLPSNCTKNQFLKSFKERWENGEDAGTTTTTTDIIDFVKGKKK